MTFIHELSEWWRFYYHKITSKSLNQIEFKNRFLRIVVSDNSQYGKYHLNGFNGISEISLVGEENNLFVPEFSGLNFEHIFSGDRSSFGWDIFEPRLAKMSLNLISKNRARLSQENTENWPLQTQIEFELEGDGVNFYISAMPLQDVWCKHGYIGMFFASYIHRPDDRSINFIGKNSGEPGEIAFWIKHLPAAHGLKANHRPVGDYWNPSFDTGFKPDTAGVYWPSLVYEISGYEYEYPFYYGQIEDKVYIIMFKKPDEGGGIRFAQSPTGGIEHSPAWDFILYKRNYKIGEKFNFSGRLVYKRFIDKEDIIKTYENWSGVKVLRPLNCSCRDD